jgi:hypothetical protein
MAVLNFAMNRNRPVFAILTHLGSDLANPAYFLWPVSHSPDACVIFYHLDWTGQVWPTNAKNSLVLVNDTA